MLTTAMASVVSGKLCQKAVANKHQNSYKAYLNVNILSDNQRKLSLFYI
jgi:hypothetical protein